MRKLAGLAVAFTLLGLMLSPLGQYQADAFKEDKMMKEAFYAKGDLTAPADEKPFGGDAIGTYKVRVKHDNKVTIIAKPSKAMMEEMMMKDKLMQGNVLEGWLVDVDSGYKLSTGQLSERNILVFNQRMVNPSIYDLLVITEEPMNDTDPSPNMPIGGAQLAEPFGQ
ncbi:MAG: hypothetical protein ACE5KA_07250 [Nitrososphaerales archaeon]